ncbi:MAG: ABC transporter permease [Thiohalocapsa sp.]|uniref:ABC transporter permease n=1 Tax=Thiohalocapsa sp. TaxID=2497641 RepID=UPI0025D89995|nr:ABC transporter permease [Thiohalocapsa sp.]MCG6943690.1 ABC transporter permease [Thiohalocapsa sp.]
MTDTADIATGGRVGVYSRAFIGLLARDTRVLRRDFIAFLLRTVMNPILFTFVFAFVFPKIGEQFHPVGRADFATILVPGLIAVAMIFQGIAAVALPLVNEFGRTREIEDRVMAPLPVAGVALEKIVFGAMQSIVAALVVFPVVAVIPATPVTIQVASWPLLVGVLLLAALISGAFGLAIGTLFRPQQVPLIFSIIVIPITFLGCVYYPWELLSPLPVLRYAVLVNPVVYISEGLRAALTPEVPHMPPVVFLGAMAGMLILLIAIAIPLFVRRVKS